MLEVRALAQATEVLRQAQEVRKGMPKAMIALSMVGKNYVLTRDMKKAAADLKLPLADSSISLRQVYADAPGQAVLVWNFGTRGKEAGDEIRSLFRELFSELKGKKRRPATKRSRLAKGRR